MKLNKLLEKQIGKHLTPAQIEQEDIARFIEAVNNSYNAFERDRALSDRAFSIAEEEYKEMNDCLQDELKFKQKLISQMVETVSETDGEFTRQGDEETDLMNIIAYLKERIINQRETKKALTEQKRFYEQILNEIPADIVVFDKRHRYLFVNPMSIKNPELRAWIIGKNDEEYCIYRNRDLSIARDRENLFNEVASSRKQKEWEERFVAADGSVEYHLRKMYPVFDGDGNLKQVIGYGVNITERKKGEEQLKLSEAKYKSIFQHSLALICTHDLEGKILSVNAAAINILGYSQEELMSKYLFDLIPAERRFEFEGNYLAEIVETGRAEGIMVGVSKNGRRNYLLYQNFLVSDDVNNPYVIGFSQDITARIEAEKALKKSEEKFRSIIANMNLGMVEVDVNEHITFANNSFCQMSGYKKEELLGVNVGDLLLKKDRNPSIQAEIMNRRRTGVSDAYELNVKNKSGESRWWLISGAPSFNQDGDFTGSIGIHLDITQQKQLEEDLRKAKSEAERSAHAKELFLANMSHEIRTPMNAILGIGKLLKKTPLDSKQYFYLDTIHNAANNLLVIMNDLLDFSKIEAGKLSLEYVGFNLDYLIANAVRVLRYKSEEKGLAFSYEIKGETAPVLIGDPYRLNQVLMNLLSNALKFTETGFIKIECIPEKEIDHIQRVVFRITDTGIGMSETFIEHLFDKFVQEDVAVTRKYGGTGLGMSICKQLIELMGGEISVQSEKNKGTTFSFYLDMVSGTARDLPDNTSVSTDVDILKGKKILLAEDNEMNRLLVNTVLSQYGAEVTEANDGAEALCLYQQQSFHLVLMDMQMPVMDGLEATRQIRAIQTKSIPIIALTANAFEHEKEKCLQAGMNDFITKPFDEDKMIQLVAHWLDTSFIPEQNDNALLAVNGRKNYDLTKLVNISRGNDEFVTKMLTLFVTETPVCLEKMKQAFAERNWMAIGALAHRIKPSLMNLGITSLTNDIKMLEQLKDNNAAIEPAHLAQCLDFVANILEKIIWQIKQTELKLPQ